MPVASTHPEAQQLAYEESFIGALMLSDPSVVLEIAPLVEEDDFFSRQNWVIFDAIYRVAKQGNRPDPVMVQQFISEKISVSKSNGLALKLHDLIHKVHYIDNIMGYLTGMVAERARREVWGMYGRDVDQDIATDNLIEQTGQIYNRVMRTWQRCGQLKQMQQQRQERRKHDG